MVVAGRSALPARLPSHSGAVPHAAATQQHSLTLFPPSLPLQFSTGYGMVLNLLYTRSLQGARAFLDRSFSRYLGGIGTQASAGSSPRHPCPIPALALYVGGLKGDSWPQPDPKHPLPAPVAAAPGRGGAPRGQGDSRA